MKKNEKIADMEMGAFFASAMPVAMFCAWVKEGRVTSVSYADVAEMGSKPPPLDITKACMKCGTCRALMGLVNEIGTSTEKRLAKGVGPAAEVLAHVALHEPKHECLEMAKLRLAAQRGLV